MGEGAEIQTGAPFVLFSTKDVHVRLKLSVYNTKNVHFVHFSTKNVLSRLKIRFLVLKMFIQDLKFVFTTENVHSRLKFRFSVLKLFI